MKVLILNGQYLPGYKGGGPIQSCANIVENLGDEIDFYVICSDRDYKENEPYPNIIEDEWNKVGKAKVFYLKPEKQTFKGFRDMIGINEYDVIYLNGFFSPIFTIKPLLLRLLRKVKCSKWIITPRGDFTGGCENKKLKKYTYIFLTKVIGLYNNLIWHSTSNIEDRDIKKKYKNAKTTMISNLPEKTSYSYQRPEKKIGKLKLVFISRIFPKKNLKYALEILKTINEGKIEFDIYGPMEDKNYWNECGQIIEKMPKNINVSYLGELEHILIKETFAKYNAFIFPTMGENYGHVIVEAMKSGCICLLPEGVTPWDNYIHETNMGGKLDDKLSFIKCIEKLVNMNQDEMNKLIEVNNSYVEKHLSVSESDVAKYRNMFSVEANY